MKRQPTGTYIPFVKDNIIHKMDTRTGEVFELLDKEDAREKGQAIDDDGHHMYQWFPLPSRSAIDLYDKDINMVIEE